MYEKALKDFEAEKKAVSAEYEKKEQVLEQNIKEYSAMIQNKSSEEAIAAKQEELIKLDEELQKSAKDLELHLGMKKEAIMDPILEDVNGALKSVTKELKLNAILQSTNIEGVSFVLCAPDETEVTEYLLRETNSGKARIFATEYKSDPSSVTIGYTNIELVLMYMPEYKLMEQRLETYTNKLAEEYDKKSNVLYSLYEEYLKKEESKSLSEQEENEYLSRLTVLNNELGEFTEEGSKEIETMRAEQMEAVLAKLQTALDKVALNNGFTFILNQATSSGVSTIVYGPDNADITFALLEEIEANVETLEKKKLVSQGNLKVGFVNVEAIMIEMPEFKTIQSNIQTFEESLLSEQKIASERLSPEDQEKSWEMAEEDFQKYRGEQLEPLMTRIQSEIDEIAKTKKYDYIINQTGGNVL
ncbi:MAG: OmpH family outer membrane protein, partial [Crocinitomicaceae bacterium]|nr:OmpH family outer membrane protein [Crocinitomicaceae bacterium]